MVWTITIAINSSANFRIYYYRAKTFKDGAKFIFDKLIGKVTKITSFRDGVSRLLENLRSSRPNNFNLSTSGTGTSSISVVRIYDISSTTPRYLGNHYVAAGTQRQLSSQHSCPPLPSHKNI